MDLLLKRLAVKTGYTKKQSISIEDYLTYSLHVWPEQSVLIAKIRSYWLA